MDDLEITLAEYATPMGRLRFCAERPNHMHTLRGADAKAIGDEIAALRARCAALENDLAEARQWTDDDQPLPEDDAILATHPDTPEGFALDREAMRLVGAKRSKGALVDLVRWLLTERDAALADAGRLAGLLCDLVESSRACSMRRDGTPDNSGVFIPKSKMAEIAAALAGRKA